MSLSSVHPSLLPLVGLPKQAYRAALIACCKEFLDIGEQLLRPISTPHPELPPYIQEVRRLLSPKMGKAHNRSIDDMQGDLNSDLAEPSNHVGFHCKKVFLLAYSARLAFGAESVAVAVGELNDAFRHAVGAGYDPTTLADRIGNIVGACSVEAGGALEITTADDLPRLVGKLALQVQVITTILHTLETDVAQVKRTLKRMN